MIVYKYLELSNELQRNCAGIISKFKQGELSKNEFKQKINPLSTWLFLYNKNFYNFKLTFISQKISLSTWIKMLVECDSL